MTEKPTRVVYEFAGFRVDPHRRQLLAGDTPVPLAARVFDTLLHFIEHRGKLLDKASLLEAIWRKVVVEENSLNQNISILRRALGENRKDHRFIVTVPQRGYRFVADVKVVTDGGRDPSANGTRLAPRSIAVLAFTNLTGDPRKEYVGDALADDLIRTLSRSTDLRVVARTSSFAYKGREADVRSIARELDVDAVLEGSVQAASERIRVGVDLVSGQTGYQLWSQTFARPFENLFALQDEIALAVLSAAGATVHGTAPSHTADFDAYHLYMQALSLSLRPSEANLRGAIDLLQRAVLRDSHFARAASLLAMQYTLCVFLDYAVPNALDLAERAALAAVALDPREGATHDALGAVRAMRGDWLAAEEHFETAHRLASDPLTNGQRSIYVTLSVGHISRSLQQAEQVLSAAKAHPLGPMMMAVACSHLNMNDETLRYIDEAIALGQPRHVMPVPEMCASISLRCGRPREAAAYWIAALSPTMHMAGGAEAVAVLCAAWRQDVSQRPVAITTLEGVQRRLPPDELDQSTWTCKRFLIWYAMLGAVDQAFALAERSLTQCRRAGTVGSAWGFLWIPEMVEFRRDPRFPAFVARLGNLVDYWHAHGPPDGCELRGRRLIVGC